MSFTGGASSCRRAGTAAGQDDGVDETSRSKRPKKESEEHKWKEACKDKYGYNPKRKFDPVESHEDPDGGSNERVLPPIIVFFNAKGGTLKTSHTWNIACTLGSELRGLKVGGLVSRLAIF